MAKSRALIKLRITCLINAAPAKSELVVLGASALMNPHILHRSGLSHPMLGKRLHEQMSAEIREDLDGLDGFQGSTSITGHGYNFYDGDHRRERAASLIETWNIPNLRTERGKWRQVLDLKFIFEDLPNETNEIRFPSDPNALPETRYKGYSDYVQKTLNVLPDMVREFLEPLPVEQFTIGDLAPTENHILGTTLMGNDPETSVIDRHLVHHRIRNLVVAGGGGFPTSGPANPSLTISALSLWSASSLLK